MGKALVGELVDGTPGPVSWVASVGHDMKNSLPQQERTPWALALSPDRVHSAQKNLRQLHSATGHCSRECMVRGVKRRNVSPDVMC